MTTIEPGVVERLVERLNERLPVCPFDLKAPKNTLEATDPCPVCGDYGDERSKGLCHGADTRIMAEAATLLAQQQARIASQQQQIDAFSLLAGDEFAQSVHSALDEAGAPRRSSDGSVIYGVVARINRLATKEPT